MKSLQSLMNQWVAMWNTFDLKTLNDVMFIDDRLTYLSSEREGCIQGFEAVRQHHLSFGFVNGGRPAESKFWLEDTVTAEFGSHAVVSGTWLFQRVSGEVQRGPFTFVCILLGDGYRFSHMHFANYLPQR